MEAGPVQAGLLAEPVVAVVRVGQVARAIGGATKAGPGGGHGGVQRAPVDGAVGPERLPELVRGDALRVQREVHDQLDGLAAFDPARAGEIDAAEDADLDDSPASDRRRRGLEMS